MNSVLKLVIILLILLVLFHYKKFRDYSEDYQIEQQELEYIIGNELYNTLNPLIITFIEKGTLKFNVEEYRLFSSITVQKNFNNLITNDSYNRHTNELLLIRSKKKIKIELINPKYITYFKKTGKSILNNFILEKENFKKVKSIDLILRQYNILYIPRHWLFKFSEKDISIEIFRSNNIFTYCFNIL